MPTPAPLNRPAALCIVAAPLVLTLGDGLQAVDHGSIHWTVALWLSFVLFVPTIFSLANVLRPHLPRYAVFAGAVALVGAMAGAAMQAFFRTVLTLPHTGLDPATAASVEASLRGNGVVVATTLMPGIFFPAGLLLLAAGLARMRIVPLPAALLLALGAVLFPVGHAAGQAAALIGGDLVLLAALGWIAYEVYSRPEIWGGGAGAGVPGTPSEPRVRRYEAVPR